MWSLNWCKYGENDKKLLFNLDFCYDKIRYLYVLDLIGFCCVVVLSGCELFKIK